MDNSDALIAADVDEDGRIKARTRGRHPSLPVKSRRSGAGHETSLRPGNNEETAPLLSRRDSLESRGAASNDDGPPEWSNDPDFPHLPWWKRPSIFWLLPPFQLFTLAFGGIVVPKLNLILTLICRDYYAEKSGTTTPFNFSITGQQDLQCQTNEISSRVSLFLLYGNLCSGILSAVTSPKLGALSDRYGRKKMIAIATLGTLVGEVITILAARYPDTFSVNWMLVGFAVEGICGSFILSMAMAHSYATDCTPPAKRNVAFAYFHACFFTGIAIGPMLTGKIIKVTGSVLSVFYIALGCHSFFIIFLMAFIPESLSKSRQHAAREKHRLEVERLGPTADWINQLRSLNLLAPLKILYPTGPGTSPALRRNLVFLAATDTIMFGVAMGAMGVIIIYTNLQFGWGTWESSKYVSIVSACRVICLMILLPLITRLVRGPNGSASQQRSGSDLFDLSVIRAAIFFDMLGYLGYTLSRSGGMFIVSGIVASIGGVGSPALGSALTKHVPPERTGQLLGATGLLHALARVLGPTVFNGIYYATVGRFRQTVFVCLSATFGLACLVSWFIEPHVYLEDLDRGDGGDDVEGDESGR